jgi:hypothetical protein
MDSVLIAELIGRIEERFGFQFDDRILETTLFENLSVQMLRCEGDKVVSTASAVTARRGAARIPGGWTCCAFQAANARQIVQVSMDLPSDPVVAEIRRYDQNMASRARDHGTDTSVLRRCVDA